MCRWLSIIGRIVLTCSIILLECACAVGSWHPSDSRLEQRFFQNQKAFEELLREVRADRKLESISATHVVYHDVLVQGQDALPDLNKSGFTKARWEMYIRRMDRLGIVMLLQGDKEVVFKVDNGKITNGDSEKGYVYSLSPQSSHRKESLDGYRLSKEDTDEHGNAYVHKPLGGHWYLFLYVYG